MTPAARKARNAAYLARTVFGVGIAVSLVANVLASKHTPIGIGVGLWTPLAFLLSMLMLEHIPVQGWTGIFRKLSIGFIALIAGWASYWHLVEVCQSAGADALTAHTLPLTVDVMMALASAGMKRKAAAPARRRTAARKAPAKAKAPARKLASVPA
jgi:hypothetical protein